MDMAVSKLVRGRRKPQVRRQPEGIEQLFPMFHGQSAQIIAYIVAKGSASAEDIRKGVGMPRSTVYKLISQLVQAGLISRAENGEQLKVPDFSLTIKNTATVAECKVTPRNVLAFDAAHTNAGRSFIEDHGSEKFGKFVELYDEYQSEKITKAVMARVLGVIRFEVEVLFAEIELMSAVED
jgi:DNA-binding MarR family transcriptional regulator